MINKPTHSYIGRCKCGAVLAVTADMPDNLKSTAQAVADMIKAGLMIERVPFDYVREHFGGCTCEKQMALFENGKAQ